MNSIIIQSFYVGIGGFLGAIARFLVSYGFKPIMGTQFPWPTLIINLLGCILLGLGVRYFKVNLDSNFALFLGTGFLGAFTTLSTVSYESNLLWEQGRWSSLIFYVGATFLGALLAVRFATKL